MKGDNVRLLIVEDEINVAKMLKTYVAMSFPQVPWEISIAETAADGVKLLTDPTAKTDVLLLDLRLQDSKDPAETLIMFSSLIPTVKTVIVTGVEDAVTGLDAIEKGAVAFVQKADLCELKRVFNQQIIPK